MTNSRNGFGLIAVMLLALLLLFMAPSQAQNFLPYSAGGSLTAASSSCLSTNCVQVSVISASPTVAWQVSGTFVGTVQFEGTIDGTNWAAVVAIPLKTVGGARVTSATAGGVWQVNSSGYAAVRVRCSAYTSGTIVVFGRRASGGPLVANS